MILHEDIEQDINAETVLLISSGGGHWIQLMQLKDAWEGKTTVYASVNAEYKNEICPSLFFLIPDGNIRTIFAIIRMSLVIFKLVFKLKPSVVISTGAAPGFFGVLFGRLFGAKTIWIDSIANSDHLSLSGRVAGKIVDIWLTQWPHLSGEAGPYYKGSII